MAPDHPVVVRGRLPDGGRLVPGAIGFDPETGLITGIGPDLQGDDEHDFGEKAILPGAVDIHVHFRDPGHPEKEDFASGTLAALCGGTTTILDMPNTDPATTTLEAYEAKRAIAREKAHVDWGLYCGATRPGDDLDAIAKTAYGIKLYLGESTGCVALEDPFSLPEVFQQLHDAAYRGVIALHAEAAIELSQAHAAHKDAPALRGHDARRPVGAELAAMDQVETALDGLGAAPSFTVHIAHVSSRALLQRVQRAGLSFGVTPNHLLLHHEMPLGARGRMNPPLRPPSDQAALFAALGADHIPIVESDHAPHTIAEKDRPVAEAPSGIPGVETLRPLLLGRHAMGEIPLDPIIRATSIRPAGLFGLRTGKLHPGYHADLAVYDLERPKPLDAARLHSKCGWTPYEGQPCVFPTDVFLRGQHLVAAREVQARPGVGREIVPFQDA